MSCLACRLAAKFSLRRAAERSERRSGASRAVHRASFCLSEPPCAWWRVCRWARRRRCTEGPSRSPAATGERPLEIRCLRACCGGPQTRSPLQAFAARAGHAQRACSRAPALALSAPADDWAAVESSPDWTSGGPRQQGPSGSCLSVPRPARVRAHRCRSALRPMPQEEVDNYHLRQTRLSNARSKGVRKVGALSACGAARRGPSTQPWPCQGR